MEPFELKLHQVTFEESDNALRQVEGQTQNQLDSFSSLVHYDADFEESAGSEKAPEHSDLQHLTFAGAGKDGEPGKSALYTYSATTTTTTTSSGLRSTSARKASPPLQSLPLPWEGKYAGDVDGLENFLVNPDDYYLTPRSHAGKVSPEVAAAGLHALSQVSINTSAVARHLRKVKGGKRRIAKTTLTSTALTTPTTMPTESPKSSSNSGPAGGTAAVSLPVGDVEGEEPGDSSFETVAEALRLQWSVIGNANVTPASPEEVARIVAEAEKRLRGGPGAGSAGETAALSQPSAADPNASDLPSVGSLSSLSSLSSSATNDNGITAVEPQVGRVSEPCESTRSAELIRIPAKSITKEVEKTSWFHSRDKPSVSSPRATDSEDDASRTGVEVRRGANGGVPLESAPISSTALPVKGKSRSESAEQNGSELTKGESGLSVHEGKTGPDDVAMSVPFGSGSGFSSDLGVKLPAGSTPYTSPSTQTTATPETPHLPQHSVRQHANSSRLQGAEQRQQLLPQISAASPQPFVSPVSPHLTVSLSPSALSGPPLPSPSPQPSPSSLPSSPASAGNDADSGNYIPSPIPTFTANLVPIPQIGPLFPKKAGGVAAQVLPSRSLGMEPQGGATSEAWEELMREKLKLEGQLEVLQEEAQTTLQERAELQAQLASLQLKLKSGQQKADDAEKASLRTELERLRATRLDHEREAMEVQNMLEEKLEELKGVTEDLYQSQDSVDKLQVRMKELRDDLQAKEVTIQALKSKIAELYVEVQTTLQSKMEADSDARTARNDLVSLVKAKEWYQEQLSTAHEVRAKLQSQLTQLQAQTVSQGSIVERLKLESGRLRQQLRESQERALREKEQLARHLEAIQQDMMEREAAFQEIQRERLMIEDTFNTQVTTVEEEKSRISSLLQLTSDLESQLEQAQGNSKKRQEQIFGLETEQMELMKKAALAQEVLLEKEQLLEEANQRLIEVESQLDAFTQTLAAKDTELRKLREDKASTEIALKAALQEKESVDKALDVLKGDMGKVEKSFKQMRQELGVRLTELETSQTQQKAARDELDRVAHELDIKSRSVDTLTQNYQEQAVVIEQLRAEKNSSEQQVLALKQQLQQTQAVSPADSSLQQALQTELHETRARLAEAETRLQVSTAQLQQAAAFPLQARETPTVPEDQLEAAMSEKARLAEELQEAEEAKQKVEREARREREELDEVVAGLRSELDARRTEFERKVEGYVGQVHQVTEEKRRLETELEMTQRKFELSSVQQRETIDAELQKLVKDLEGARLHGQEVEQQLYALRTEKEAEVATLRQELAGLQQSLQDAALQQQQSQQDTAALNRQLALELERERGRIAGLQQSNSTLKDHMKQLEEALAGRESSLMELKSHLESGNREREKEQQEYLRRIQELEVSLKKEKDGGRDLRKQIGSKITENRRLLKQQDAHRKDQGELQEEVDRRQKEATHLQTELEAARQAVRDQQGELQSMQAEKLALEAELERARRELLDNRDRNPVLLEQIQSLEWQVSQRSQEVQAAKEQLALTEQRQANEAESLRRALQDKQDEVDSLQGELASARQEKADQKSRVSELRSVLKASVQHHKLTKKLNTRKKERGGGDADSREEKATQADMGNGVIIPPLPFDMEAVEQLLLDTAVTPLDSKPLDNLSTCLSSLKAEISGLQKQMEVHTTTIHSSTVSWRNVESEVKGLQEVVRSIANTIMDGNHTTTSATTTTAATDTEMVDDGDIVHL